MAAVNLADAYINILPSLKGIAPGISGMTSKFEAGGKKSGGLFSGAFAAGVGGAIGGIAAQAIGTAVGKVKDGIGEMVSSFSELEDATGAASVVFGDKFMGPIIKQSEDAARTMGMTKSQVIDAANTFGTFGKAAGLSGEQLVGFSKQMTQLAGDLSSFKGGSPEEAIQAIGAAMRGESEPIRRYGVLLDDATLKQRALKMGLISTTKQALTPQQRTLAAQAEILAQTKDATGDFLRTQNSTANVAKRFDATMKNLGTTVGQIIAPAFTLFKGVAADALGVFGGKLEGLLPRVNAFWENFNGKVFGAIQLLKTGDFTSAIQKSMNVSADSPLVKMILKIRSAFTSMMPTVHAIGSAISQVFNAIGPTIAGILPNILQVASGFSPLHIIFQAIRPLIPQIAQALQQVVQVVAQIMPIVGPAIGQISGALSQILGTLLAQLLPVVTGVISAVLPVLPVIAGLVNQVLGAVLPLVASLAGPLMAVIQGLIPPLTQIIQTVVAALMPVLPALGQIIAAVAEVLQNIVAAITPLIPPSLTLVQVLVSALMPLLPPIVELITTVAQLVAQLLAAISPLLPAITSLVSAGISVLIAVLTPLIQVITFVAQVIISVLNVALRAVMPVVTGVIGIFSTFVNLIVGVVSTTISTFANTVTTVFNAIFSVTRSIWDGIYSAISTVVTTIGNFITSGFTAVRTTINGAWNAVKSLTTAAWSYMTSSINSGVNKAISFVKSLPGRALAALGNLGSYLYNSGASLLQGFINGIKSGISKAVNAVSNGLKAIRSYFPFSPAKRGPFSGRGWVVYSGASVFPAFAEGMQSQLNAGVQVAESFMDKTQAVMSRRISANLQTTATYNPYSDTANPYGRNGITVNQYIQSAEVPRDSELASAGAAQARLIGAI